MRDLKSMTLEELEFAVEELGEKKFRAKQIFEWFHKRLASSLDEMNNLPKNLKEKLQKEYGEVSLLESDSNRKNMNFSVKKQRKIRKHGCGHICDSLPGARLAMNILEPVSTLP